MSETSSLEEWSVYFEVVACRIVAGGDRRKSQTRTRGAETHFTVSLSKELRAGRNIRSLNVSIKLDGAGHMRKNRLRTVLPEAL